jgi:ribosome maturation factor RimP
LTLRYRKWAWPTFFSSRMRMTDLQEDIKQQLSELDSQLDVVAVEQPGTEMLRIYIDHPEGVDLALCERVTKHLSHLRADYSLEVSSRGPKYSSATQSTEVKETP